MKNKMECGTVEQMLACDYIDGNLAIEDRQQIDQHLKECETCHKTAEDFLSIARTLRQTPKVDAPPELLARIRHQIIGEHKRQTISRISSKNKILEILMMRPITAAIAAMILIVALGGGFMLFPLFFSGNGSGANDGLTTLTDLNALTGNMEIIDQHAGFGSNIELLLM